MQHFDSDLSIVLPVIPEADRGHCTTTELAVYGVVSFERCTDACQVISTRRPAPLRLR